MIARGKKTFLYLVPSLLLLVFSLSSRSSPASEQGNIHGIAPDHAIVLKDQQPKPSWMLTWEKARAAARAGDDQQAAEFYLQLFSEKPQIEEALREYVLVLMNLKRWEEAGAVVQQLLEFDPDSFEYQLYGGRIALVLEHYERAVYYLGQVYSLSPAGDNSLEALTGQIKALHHLGREEIAYPLMEQLYTRSPNDVTLVRNLARSSLRLGYQEKAQMYYRVLLTELQPVESDYMDAEPLFTAAGDEEMSVICWQGYLQDHPYYLPFHEKLSEYYLKKGEEKEALPHLLVRIALGDNRPHIYLATAKIYTYQAGRPDKALHYYDEYRKRKPSDTSIAAEIKRVQAVLADDLLVIVENEGAWPLWRDLAKVIPDRLAVYYSMAEKLEALGKEKELLEVLEIIHQHNPDDSGVMFQLAHLYYDREDFTASTGMLNKLPAEEQSRGEYYLLRAKIEEENRSLLQAINHYRSYLYVNPHDYPAVLRAMELAGETSSIEDLHHFYTFIPAEQLDWEMYYRGKLHYGNLLKDNYLTSAARRVYEDLLGLDRLSSRERLELNLLIVETLQNENDHFSAEELLRRELINEDGSDEIITALIETRLQEHDWDGAWKWYELLGEGENDTSLTLQEWEFNRFLWKVEIHKRGGQTERALEMLEDHLRDELSGCVDVSSMCNELKVRLLELYLIEQRHSEAVALLDTITGEHTESTEFALLGELARTVAVDDGEKQAQSAKYEGQDIGAIDRALLLEDLGFYEEGRQLIRDYLHHDPTSLQARVLHGRLLIHSGDDPGALAVFKDLTAQYPDESGFRERHLQLLYKAAKFDELVVELSPQWPGGADEKKILPLHRVPEDVSMLPVREKLLLARTFWAMKRWNDALLIYESIQESPVDHEFSQQLALADVDLVLPPPKKTFWHKLTFTSPAEPDRLTVVMSPRFTSEHLHKPPVSIAAGLYGTYRWQQIVSRELSVRQDMKDGDYYQAMKEYQKLLDHDPSMESLYDLAGIYSRLGMSGKEMELYEIIKKESPGYPDLDEAIRRNTLKRKPRMRMAYHWGEKSGRDGYYDNRAKAGGVQGWLMPSLTHEIFLDLQRIYNKSIEVEQSLWRNRAIMDMRWSPVYDLDFQMAVGADRADDNRHGTFFLYTLEMNGRIGDMVQGYGRLAQDVVDDTVEALEEGIKGKEYGLGFSLDFLPRLFGGYDYRFTEYSDANHQNRYELWASYILMSEPQLLQFRYGYEYFHNAETNRGRDYSLPSGFVSEDHPYWTPKEYWQHLFSVSFEHQLAEDVLGRSAPSYYSLKYTFGYENEGYDNHQFKGQIFLEMSRNILLNGSFDYTHGSEYKEQDFLLSLIYRW